MGLRDTEELRFVMLDFRVSVAVAVVWEVESPWVGSCGAELWADLWDLWGLLVGKRPRRWSAVELISKYAFG